MALVSDSGFRPDRHGFGFPNLYRDTVIRIPWPAPLLLPKGMRYATSRARVVADGRCGGISFAALDYFVAALPVPRFANEEMPPPDAHPLSVFIGRRQRDSLLSLGALRFLTWTVRRGENEAGRAGALTDSTMRSTLDQVSASLARGRPVVLGLVRARRLGRVFENHQVVAYALESDEDAAAVLIYDSRFPLKTHRLRIQQGFAIRQFDDRGVQVDEWRGAFVLRYVPAEPPRWDRAAHTALPPEPAALAATPEGDGVLLTWVADAALTSGCEVQRRAENGSWRRVALVREPDPALYRHVAASPLGPDASFRVRALNHNGYSEPTLETGPPDRFA